MVGSYAKVLLRDDVPVAYCQFGPLTAYPRAQQTRDLYPPPAVRAAARGHHLHRDDARGARRRAGPASGPGGLRRPRGAGVRRRRGLPGGGRQSGRHECGDPGVLARGRVRARDRRRAVPRDAPGAGLSRRPAPRASGRAWVALLVVVVGLMGCGGSRDPASSPTREPVGPSATASATTLTSSPAVTPPPSTTPSPASSGAVGVDLALLDHLPPSVDGLPVEADAETSASIAASPSLASDASAIAIARVVSTTSDDLAIASIVRLRSGPLGEAASRAGGRPTTRRPASRPAASRRPRSNDRWARRLRRRVQRWRPDLPHDPR